MIDSLGSYDFFDHAADVGIRIEASSCASLFATAGRAVMDWIGRPPGSDELCRRAVQLRAEDLEELMVRWLQELIYEFQHRHSYTERAENLDVATGSLSATLVGRSWDESCHGSYREVKAVTYHQLKIVCQEGLWRASIILDV